MDTNFDERNEEMRRLRFVERRTLREIGDMYGVTHERVRQITGPNDGKYGRSQDVLEAEKKLQDDRYEFAANHPEMTTKELADALGFKKESHAAKYWNGTRHAISRNTMPNTTRKGFEIEEIVSGIMKAEGISNYLTNSKPYDIILADGRTVEVRARFKPERGRTSENFWFWPMSRERNGSQPADFYVLVISPDKHHMACFVIPRKDMPDAWALGFVWPEYRHRNKRRQPDYRQYFDNWSVMK